MDSIKIGELYSKLKPRILESVGVWQPYTPVWSSSGTNPNIGNGTIIGRYCVIGKMCTVVVKLNAGSTTTFGTGNYKISLPVPGKVIETGYANLGLAHIRDTTVKSYLSFIQMEAASDANNTAYVIAIVAGTNSLFWTPTYPFTFGNGDYFWMQISYEI
jgi:hypothetical protein